MEDAVNVKVVRAQEGDSARAFSVLAEANDAQVALLPRVASRLCQRHKRIGLRRSYKQ